MWRQFPPNLKKNLAQNSVEAVPAESQICPKKNPPRKYVEAVPADSQEKSAPKLLWRQFPPNLKKNPPQKYVEAVPAETQKESAQNSVEAIPAKSVLPKEQELIPEY